MSVREEDRNKNCPSRGLGIAAAAIGVGVGAALYYIFSKRAENPSEDGATSSSWSAAEHALHDSYSTISEHTTTDTSINSSSSEDSHINRRHFSSSDSDTDSDSDSSTNSDSDSDDETSDQSDNQITDNDYDETLDQSVDYSEDRVSVLDESLQSDDETNMEFDVTRSSMDVPSVSAEQSSRSRSPMMQFGELTVMLRNRVQKSANIQLNKRRENKFRERSWVLEQCSICFDMMQKEQEVLSLACTHRFHQTCIVPWLEQQQTCPVCRKPS